MRNVVIGDEFHHLRVDQDHPEFIGVVLAQQTEYHAIEEDRFPRTGGPGDEKVRHGGQGVDLDYVSDILPHEEPQAGHCWSYIRSIRAVPGA